MTKLDKILLASVFSLKDDPFEYGLKKPYPPLGILYVASYLRKHGFSNDEICMFDATFNPGWKKFDKLIKDFQPDIMGITTNTITAKKTVLMIKKAKTYNPELPIVVGGPGPSMDNDFFLNAGADCVVNGEGEKTAVEVFSSLLGRKELEFQDIQGISYIRKQNVFRNIDRPLIQDLDAVPLPARDLLNMEAYQKIWKTYHGNFYASIITARGCPYKCKWCARDLSFGRKYRYRSVNDVITEIKELKEKYNVEGLRFVDDILTVNRKRSMKLFQAMIDEDAVIPFECLTRVDLIDRQLLKLMKQAGLQLIHFGVESGSQRVLDAMDKGIKVKDIYRTSILMKKHDIQQSWFLMMAYPPEEWNDLQKTFSMTRDLLPDKYGVTVAYPLINTRFYQDLIDKKLLKSPSHWEQSLDNRLLFHAAYSELFYKWAIRKLHLTIKTRRIVTKHSNIVMKFLDTGAVVCSDLFLKSLAKLKMNSHNSRKKVEKKLIHC